MTKKEGGTRTRFISGLIAFLVVLPILLFGGYYGPFLLALVAAAIGLHEFGAMALSDAPRGTRLLLLILGLPFYLVSAFSTGDGIPGLEAVVPGGANQFLAIVLVALALSGAWFVLTAERTDGLADQWSRFLLGLLYVPLLLGLFPALVRLDGGVGWLWVPLFVAWCGDIGAYFAGRAFGRRKMLPKISPGKTWEGFFGGMCLAILGLCLFKFVFYDPLVTAEHPLSLVDCLLLGTFGHSFAALGDLVESMLKRTYGVKDSGQFLPGHGGILDRVDAVLFALVAVYCWAAYLRPLVS